MQTEKFYEICDYYYKPFWETRSFKLITLSILAILLISITIFLIKRFFKKAQIKVAPWDWANNKLNSFTIKKLLTKDDFKKFYFDLTDILKIYFHKRFDWQTKDKTDAELIKYLNENNLDKNIINDLRSLTESALLIKYASHEALKTQAEKDLDIAKQVIDKTKPDPISNP